MRLTFLTSATALAALISCSSPEKPNTSIEGFWADTSGMALFEVVKKDQSSYEIRNSLGNLVGDWKGDGVHGVTALNDSFHLTVQGDTAFYSVLGINLAYHRVNKAKYDSLAGRLAP